MRGGALHTTYQPLLAYESSTKALPYCLDSDYPSLLSEERKMSSLAQGDGRGKP
jgi:hypothetical protein